MDDTRSVIAPVADSTIKGNIITMVTSLATYTNDIQLIINLLNNFPTYTMEKDSDSQTLKNDENFKSTLKDAVKDNRDIIHIYIKINNLHFKPSFETEIFEDISEDPLPT